MALQTTTVINQRTSTTSNNTDIQSENELTNITSASNKSDDSEPVFAAAVEGTVAKETAVRSRNSESVAALSGGIDISSDDMAVVVCGGSENVNDDVATECGGGSELMCTINANRGEEDAAAINCKNDIDVGEISVIEKDENDDKETEEREEDTAILNEGDGHNLENDEEVLGIDVKNESGDNMVENIDNDGDEEETVKREEETTVLKGGAGENNEEIVGFDVRNDTRNVKAETIDNDGDEKEMVEREEEIVVLKEGDVEDMVGSDVKNDDEDVKLENIDNAGGESIDNAGGENLEAMTEECLVEEVMKEEEMVANEEITDEKESFDTEMEAEKSVYVEMETEKTLDIEKQGEKLEDADMETKEEENLGGEDKIQEEEEEKEEEMESESELPESSQKVSSVGTRKRGKITKAASKVSTTPRKTIEEYVCFICFDGGGLVLYDRRNCPKTYHPSCVSRDEAFFQSKGRWNCGWHLCGICEKKAEYMCYTCTYSLCKACTKTSVILCVREKEKKGLCEACMKTVMLIEKQEDHICKILSIFLCVCNCGIELIKDNVFC